MDRLIGWVKLMSCASQVRGFSVVVVASGEIFPGDVSPDHAILLFEMALGLTDGLVSPSGWRRFVFPCPPFLLSKQLAPARSTTSVRGNSAGSAQAL